MSENLFVQNRKTDIAEKKIKAILWYVIECYTLKLQSKKTYSKVWVKDNTAIHLENFLRNRLVEDYLIQNKDLLKQKTPTLNEINFTCESEKEYIDSQDGKHKTDKIDIFVNKLGLQSEWKEQDENLYFAIECKRIKKSSYTADTEGYISDIEKFCNRSHKNTRLPFEGQIAFIENEKISYTALYSKINKQLECRNSIITDSKLSQILLNDKYRGTYLSKHKRKITKQNFSIYHLLLDYSSIVVE